MLSALLMFRRFRIAMGFAFREEDFGWILGAAAALVFVGTMAYTLGRAGASSTASTSLSRR